MVEYDSVGSDGSDDESLSVYSGQDTVSLQGSLITNGLNLIRYFTF